MRKRIRKTPIAGRVIAGILGLLMTIPFAALVSCFKDNKNNEVLYEKGVSFVAIDINPSVEFLLDSDDTVVSVYAANEDAEIMLYNSEGILGESVDEATANLAELAEKYGYVTESNNNVSVVSVAENETKSKDIFDRVKTSFESGCKNVQATVFECRDAVLGAMLEKVKEEYPDNQKIQELDTAHYRLICSAMLADKDLSVTAAAEMSVEELTELIDDRRAETKNIISQSMGMAVESAELVCYQTKANLLNAVYIKYGGLEAVKYIALDNAYFTVALISKAKSDLAQFGITEEAARQVALDLGIPMEKADEFVADCKNSEGYITDETLSYAVNKWYRNADAALQAAMDENMPEFAAKLDEFSKQVNKITSPIGATISSALDTLKAATGIELSFSIKTYEDVELLAAELKTKAEESKQRMMDGLSESEITAMEADIAELDGKITEAEANMQKAIEKAKSEAEKLLKEAQEKRAQSGN